MFIRTSRLFLRPAWVEDAAAVHAALSDWEIVRQMGRIPWPYTRADAEAFCAPKALATGEASFLIFRRTGGVPELVGSAGIGPYAMDGSFEIGYWLARAHWGQGYAVEAGRALLALAFEGLRHDELGAGHYSDNPASGRVLRRLGFESTGEVVPYPCLARGCDAPSVEYLLTRDRWAAQASLPLAA